ncbi:hypothetical protein LKV13_02705 [Borrelia sp. BU AG58]|uniref:hypothetical protein n=1 Tax=Borrelia sp. BU AG58 TaxID=2887345 RepID=UPI001E30D49B|nr:hypothetical protein [Borrelia sp. BU AG58]UER67699.1 hypothetical protein LKV13_02705 [Borrelia sp. BU AG58]
MKKFLAVLFLLTSLGRVDASKGEGVPDEDHRAVLRCDRRVSTLFLDLKINENASIEVTTQSGARLYEIPKVINPDVKLEVEIAMDDISSITLNNIERKVANTEIEESKSKKLKVLISQNEYSIEFNLEKNTFPIMGFKAREKILNPIISELYSEKETQKIALSNILKYTSLKNENDEIKLSRNNKMIQISEIGYINMNDYYDINKPINSDLKFILNYKKENYRRDSFEIFNLIADPEIYILKFKRLKDQSLMLKRLAFFTEKKNFRGKILSNKELENKKGWTGHNYRLEDIVEFFNMAKKMNAKLNKEELILRNIIIINKLVYIKDHTLRVKDKSRNIALASYSEDESMSKAAQMIIFMHEILHMYFFTDNNINKEISDLWHNDIPQKEKRAWIKFLDNKGYDIKTNGLVINEFYAYTIQIPKEDIAEFLISTTYFPKSGVKNYEGWASKLEELLWNKKGLIAGELLVLLKDEITKDKNIPFSQNPN